MSVHTMTWILIFWLTHNSERGMAITSSSVPGFADKASCVHAGEAIDEEARYQTTHYVCVASKVTQ